MSGPVKKNGNKYFDFVSKNWVVIAGFLGFGTLGGERIVDYVTQTPNEQLELAVDALTKLVHKWEHHIEDNAETTRKFDLVEKDITDNTKGRTAFWAKEDNTKPEEEQARINGMVETDHETIQWLRNKH